MTGAVYQKIKRYLRQEEEKLTNDIVDEIDKLDFIGNENEDELESAVIQLHIHENIATDLDRLDAIKNNYKTISELYLIELEERV